MISVGCEDPANVHRTFLGSHRGAEPYAGAAWLITEALAGIDGQYDLGYGYMVIDGADPWKKYSVSAPAFPNTLKEIIPGWSYWIRAVEDCVWQLPSHPLVVRHS